MTMTATYGSARCFLGGPGAAYNDGLAWVLLSMTQVATGYFILMVLGKKFAIVTRKFKAVTMVDFLKERYQSKWVVLLSAFSIIIFLFSAMAAQWIGGARLRSEEHTSELQSRGHLVCRLLLEKKKT